MSKASRKATRKVAPAQVEAQAPVQEVTQGVANATEPTPAQETPAAPEAKKEPKVRYAKREWTATDIITLVTMANPKSGKSKLRYALYVSGMSVADYATAVTNAGLGGKTIANADLRWDVARGFIAIAPKAE